jgi:ABC-type nickel/cobalt efflux system permease component RcnA
MRRTQEIGIRMALGAERGDVLRLVLGEGARMALLGVVIGIAASLAITRLMTSLLFGVSATDPLTFVGVALLLCLVALLASYIPAPRAMRLDPDTALRYEESDGRFRSQPPVETSEDMGEHERHDQDACAEDEHVGGLAQIEAADAADEQVADGEIEEAPRDIDRRGGQADARR